MARSSPAGAERAAAEAEPGERVRLAREAQRRWAAVPLRSRLEVVRRLRRRLATDAEALIATLAGRPGRSPGESVAAELLPLADACRFLERSAERLLAPRRIGRRGRPAWLFGHAAEIWREPLGVVLVIAPDNYPLLLPGVQLLQALAAGNTVLVKPAPGCSAPLALLLETMRRDGLPSGVAQLLGEDIEDARRALRAGVDHVVLTGSAETGRAVLAELAPRLTPATMELSGCDAAFVLPGANLGMVADALAFGLRLNGGATCIAPRRVFVTRGEAAALERQLGPRLAALEPAPIAERARSLLRPLLAEAESRGARFVPARPGLDAPRFAATALFDADPGSALLRADVFAPILAVVAVEDMADAVRLNGLCSYALGASIFGPADMARALAREVDAGSITINDLIVPTADPRLPFGGRRASGFGVTRGADGLLALTRVKTVALRRGSFRPHYAPPEPAQLEVALGYLRAAHAAGWRERARSLKALLGGLRGLSRSSASGTRPPPGSR
ncbi:MAG: aldehyde dehydrogenase [Geminicoccaceae bacterium]|jgi:acyl-CoA reductase-like NAD-dependent aldehyde dehydrogenase|nr:aldehyde dehydrogenase [Geminicoccaceae bacterium]